MKGRNFFLLLLVYSFCGQNFGSQLEDDFLSLENVHIKMDNLQKQNTELLAKLDEALKKLDYSDLKQEKYKKDMDHKMIKVLNVVTFTYEKFGSEKEKAVSPLEQKLDAIGQELKEVSDEIKKIKDKELRPGKTETDVEENEEMTSDEEEIDVQGKVNVLAEIFNESKTQIFQLLDTMESKLGGAIAKEGLVLNTTDESNEVKEKLPYIESLLSAQIREIAGTKDVIQNATTKLEKKVEDMVMTLLDLGEKCLKFPGQNGSEIPVEHLESERILGSLGRMERELKTGMEEMETRLTTVCNASNGTWTDVGQVTKGRETITSSKLPEIVVPTNYSPTEPTAVINERHCSSKHNMSRPTSCWQLYESRVTCDDLYRIYIKGKGYHDNVYCDMNSKGGGWTVLMRRGDFEEDGLRENFNRNWDDYKNGFGNPRKEFWIGNENMHHLTKRGDMFLQIVLRSFDGEELAMEYGAFSIGSEKTSYKIHIDESMNTQYGTILEDLDGQPFSTFDKHSALGSHHNLATRYKAGWWWFYFSDTRLQLTGPYYKETDRREERTGIQWYTWKNNNVLKGAEMRIRPRKSF